MKYSYQMLKIGNLINYMIVFLADYKFKNCVLEQGMSLKQHNDIVEKLLKQIDTKDSEIESLKKQLHKAGGTQIVQSKNVQAQKQINKKITQLHKQYKQKISTLQQQIRSRSTQNKDLKERLNTLKNLQAKQKEQVSQILKKTANMASYDPKFAAVVSHYESQIQRKDKHIQNLQKQIKENFYKLKTNGKQLKQSQQNEEQNQIPFDDNIIGQINKMPAALNDSHYHTRYQQEINNLKSQNGKLQRILQQKSKQFKDLTKRYSDLTKEYYKVINQYGQSDSHNNKNTNQVKNNGKANNQLPQRNMIKKSGTGIGKILQQMLQDSKDETSSMNSEQSLSYSFLSNYAKNGNDQKFLRKSNEYQTETQSLRNIIENIQGILDLSNHIQIVPVITKMKSKLQQSNIYQNIAKTIHSMLYRLGMGKIPMSSICEELEKLETRICKLMESSDLLDEICIEAGAKKEKLLQKIRDFKATQQLLFKNMKDIDFMQKLPKANKVIQFINYFQLDKQQCEIPEQLRKMYEQLKYVDRFLKQAAMILNKEPQGLERSFESILRYLELKQAEEGLTRQQRQTKTLKTKKK